MTDPKGDRSKGPADQPDPDQYVHIVERRDDGIVIRGAKLHMTGAVNSHEILIMPTTAMNAASKDYAFICSVPVDAPGITMIFGRQANDSRRDLKETIDVGKPSFGVVGGEALIAFEDVFVPWENVYMDGETDYAGLVVHRFAAHHRANYGACKTGLMDVLTGAVHLPGPGPGDRQRLPRPRQGHRDDSSERDVVQLVHRLFGRGRSDAIGRLYGGHDAGQRLQAQRDPVPF